MANKGWSKDWKLDLRYGRRKTPYSHYTVIAECIASEPRVGFECRSDSAFMGMKIWASSADAAADMIRVVGRRIGFKITGRAQVYETEPVEPLGENPRGYDITLTSFDVHRT